MRPEASLTWPACVLLSLNACLSSRTISFGHDIRPVLDTHCLSCHASPAGKGYLATGLDLGSHATLMRGSLYGKVVTPGNSRTSVITMLVEGRADPSMRMPHDGTSTLTAADIEVLRLWINQGAKDN